MTLMGKRWEWWGCEETQILQKWDASLKRLALSRNDGLGGGTTASSLQGGEDITKGYCRT